VSEKPRSWAQDIMAQVQVNSSRLEGCAGPHDFAIVEDGRPGAFVKKWRCSRCEGTADGVAVFWYKKGLAHGQLKKEGTPS
jgi:hypothetical protein